MLVIFKSIIALVTIVLCAVLVSELVKSIKDNKFDMTTILVATLISIVPALVGLILVL